SDVPLLDELAELLGPHEAQDDAAAAAARKEQAEFAEGVLDSLVSRSDSMDDEDHLFATDLLYADDLAGRFEERDTRDLVERAAA
ncbi:helicase, partial [Mycobacterium kansasii]